MTIDPRPSGSRAASGRCRECGRELPAGSYIQTRMGSFCTMACAEKAELTDTRFAGSLQAPPPRRRSILWAPIRLTLIVFLILVIVYSYLVLFRGMAGPLEFVEMLRELAGGATP
jgi:hypothetical protein